MQGDRLFGRLTRRASLVSGAYERFFRHIQVDEAWQRAVSEAALRGPVLYVLRNVSLLDLLALDYLTRRFDLPRITFANELSQWVDTRAERKAEMPMAARLCTTIERGASAVLFLKRAPSVLQRAGGAHRGRTEGDDLLRELFRLQDRLDREIMLVPQTLVWTQRPERLGFSLVDTLLGPADFPGDVRAGAQFLLNYKNCVLRAGEAVSLREVLARDRQQGDEADPRRLTYALLRKVERQRRAILGPAQKPPDRVREEVLRSPKLQAAIRDQAGPDDAAQAKLTAKAREMLEAMAAAPEPQTLKGLEISADVLVDRLYAGVDVDHEGLARVREAAQRGSLVYLPSHKSHVDYILLAYVLRKNALQIPVVAAGDNLSFFPIGPLFRRAGAFFIRRKWKGDRLYASVVDAYVRRLMRDGWAIEFFLEGGRSRTGKLLTPQLGLLNMVVDAALSLEGRTVTFVPVSIGYERMMEEGAYARELSGGEKRKEDATALLHVGRTLREKYGRANVQFGELTELSTLAAELGVQGPTVAPARRRAIVSRLAHRVMSEVNRVTAVTPGALVAMALLCRGGRGVAHVELVRKCARLFSVVRELGARTTPSLTRSAGGAFREEAIREAALLYVRAGTLAQHVPGDTLTGAARKRARIYTGDDVIYRVPDDKRIVLDYAKNSLLHLFVDRALVSVAFFACLAQQRGSARGGAPEEALREDVRALSRLFKYELIFRADASFDRIFDETIAAMIDAGELSRSEGAIVFGQGHRDLDGRAWITFYAATVRNFLESYRIAARTLRVLSNGPSSDKAFVERALRVGEQMFLGGEIERSEAVSRTPIETALLAFAEHGYLVRSSGKLALAESLDSESDVSAIEERIAGYLLRRSGETGW